MSRRDNHSFRRVDLRLTAGYVGVLAGILVVFGTVVVLGFWQQSRERQDEALLDLARSAVGAETDLGPDGSDADFGPDGAPPVEFEPEVALISISPDGSLVTQTTSGDILALPYLEVARESLERGSSQATTVDARAGRVRVVSVPVVRGGEAVAVVQAAQETAFVTGTVGGLVFVLLPIGVLALALATVGGLVVSRRAMRPVEAAFDRQRAFVADASHELKTPLAIIRADAEVLARSELPDEDRELVSDVLEETDRMSGILSDLLLLARLDSGKTEVTKSSFDLSDCLTGAVSRFGSRARDAGISLELHVEGRPVALGDEARTAQIVASLLDNALRFTPPGGTVRVNGESSGHQVVVTVSDTGPGVPERDGERVFERFYRAEESRTRAGGGTGLGLTIARELASSQGGALALSRSGVPGASFVLTLPAARV